MAATASSSSTHVVDVIRADTILSDIKTASAAAIESATAKLIKQQSCQQQARKNDDVTANAVAGRFELMQTRNMHVKFLVCYARTSKELRESINQGYEEIEARFQRLLDQLPFRNLLNEWVLLFLSILFNL